MAKAKVHPNKQHLLLHSLQRKAKSAYAQGDFQQALNACLHACKIQPSLADAWVDAAVNAIKLERWADAITYANQALRFNARSLALFDALSHAHGALKQWPQVRLYGLQALQLRSAQFDRAPPLPAPAQQGLPPAPSLARRARNIIAFSLFGGDSKYCESAVLNATEQPQIYPHWTCRFYLDDSVPQAVVQRLQAAGAQVVLVDEATRQLPGPMWRFMALADPQVDRVLLRDADSVISLREARAVAQWLASDKHFHAMRDSASHTELLLAGLWGAVPSALPPIKELLASFAAQPIANAHFADQFFLREWVWPYARLSLLQHDSLFGFLDPLPFPDGPAPDDFHVGYAEGSPFFSLPTPLPENTAVDWHFYQLHPTHPEQARIRLCSYPAQVSQGQVRAHLPARYAKLIEIGQGLVRLTARQD
ncbi:tetratricopeptide repeat protein [Pseudomonas sp. 5P_3.1_Bac2]|uniref:tetratricopeptide repeat protein n=1 Tax=Pseudomonas sp. 5P_3.1_Bac2 TaxID=2971617 RepID=UPI0021C809C5|nr:tetratricopeptide repeat protein [Pseudomonas sp. 5P_3.1_Bac2]MCU1715763.1 tetratricopeptide repeat protein [Pseudomonas sp. 5P_3.1_Bac2]